MSGSGESVVPVDLEMDDRHAPVWMTADQANGWSSGWNAAVKFLRDLPVEQRMEAMGMLRNKASFDGGMTWEDVWTE